MARRENDNSWSSRLPPESIAGNNECSGRASVARCPPEPRLRPLFRRQQRVQRRYRWHLCVALYGGTMPGKNRAFTTLVDPVSPPSIPLAERERMVEAPGTAPGSDTLMPRGVYRHSRFPDAPYIGVRRGNLKAFEPAANETHGACAEIACGQLASKRTLAVGRGASDAKVRPKNDGRRNAPLLRPAG